MSSKGLATFLAGMVAGLIFTLAGWHPQAAGQRAEKAPQWEYRIGTYHGVDWEKEQAAINKLGADGWEYAGLLTTSTGGRTGCTVAFKRLKK